MDALTEDDLLDLPLALEGVMQEMQPAGDSAIAVAVGAVVGLIGQNWSRAGRDEFTILAIGEFLKLPGSMVLDGLERARHRVVDGRLLVAWIFDDVEPKAAKLKVECERLAHLANLAADRAE